MRRALTLISCSLIFLPAGVSAAESPTLFGQPVTVVEPLSSEEVAARASAFEAMLKESDRVLVGDQVLPRDVALGIEVIPTGANAAPSEWTEPPHRATIFLNFFGAELKPGNNAAKNESPCVGSTLDYPGFSGNEQQALALINTFESKMEPYGVRIAYEERPPAHLPYAMVMMGGLPSLLGLPGGVLGVSCSNDCGDRVWRDLTFAFTAALNGSNTQTLGNIALHEAAHAFGLAHIANQDHMMYPYANPGNKEWATSCTPYDDATGGINCKVTHQRFCGEGVEKQDSAAELLAYFGENSFDAEPPLVNILAPADGAELAAGSDLTVEVDVTDNHEGVGWRLVIPEVDQSIVAYAFENKFELNNLPEGVYTLRVEAIDHERNEAFDEVKIYVGMDAPPEPATTSGSESDTDDGGGTTDATGGESDPSAGETADVGTGGGVTGTDTDTGIDGDDGCGCRSGEPSAPAGAWMLVFLGLAVAPRRRR
jgi:MYXO-CTERM domain-containing protein